MPRLEIALLGPPQIQLDGHAIKTDRRKAVALLAYLAVTGQPHTRDQLAALLWPDYEQDSAFAYLRRTLWELNQILGKGWINADRDSVALEPTPELWLDTAAFQALIRAPANNRVALTDAITLYRGDFLAGFTVADTAPFEDWQFQQAEYFRREFAGTLEKLVEAHAQSGEHATALPYARRWLALDPLNEAAHRALMRLLAEMNDRAGAIRQYETCVQILQAELGIAPQPETTTLYETILHGNFQPAHPEQATLPSPAEPRPTLRLPMMPTPFIGRRPEIEQVTSLINDPNHRLITLTGPGGTGKTRLSIQAASEVADAFPNGLVFVPLAPLLSVDGIVPAVAKALDFSFYKEKESPRQQLFDYLRDKRLLLILDNFEHLVNEGTALVTAMLAAARGVKLLVTSRVRLNVQGEQVYPVAGMRAPNAREVGAWDNPEEQAKPFSAVQLFVERARRARSTFALTQENLLAVVEICRLVEGSPLGLELAAAWLELLPPAEIAAEIARSLDFLETDQADVPDRQRSIRAVFESSWKLLNASEREAFQRLSVFAGSFSREAAQPVSGASLRTLLGLANKSWLQQTDNGRFQLHELMRQYGAERLQTNAAEWTTAKERHTGYYAEFMVTQGRELRGAGQRAGLDAIEVEFDSNIRSAWNWLVENGRFEELIEKILPGLFHVYLIEGNPEAMIAMIKQARKAVPTSGNREHLLQQAILETVETRFELSWLILDDQPRERLLNLWERANAQSLGYDMGFWHIILLTLYRDIINYEEGTRQFQEFMPRILSQTDPWVLGYGFLLAGNVLELDSSIFWNVHFSLAENYLTEALAIFRKIGVTFEQGVALQRLGDVAGSRNDFAEAIHLKKTSLEIFRKAGAYLAVGHLWHELAILYLYQGNIEQAFYAYQESKQAYEKIGNRRMFGSRLSRESIAASRYSTLDHAMNTRQRSLEIAREVGNQNDLAWHTWEMGEVYRLMGDYDQARTWYQTAYPLFKQVQALDGLGYYHRGFGDIALEMGQWAEARKQFQEMIAILSTDQRNSRPWDRAYGHTGLGHALIELGDLVEAKVQFKIALQDALKSLALDIKFLPLTGFAHLRALGQREEAIELAAFILHHPVSWNETKKWARAVLEGASRNLPEEAAQAAIKRGQALELERVLEWMLNSDEGL